MIYLKSVTFGLTTAILGLVAWVVGSFIVGLIWMRTQIGIESTGAGGLGAVSFGVSEVGVLLVALASFLLGSTWMYRRLRRRATRRESSR